MKTFKYDFKGYNHFPSSCNIYIKETEDGNFLIGFENLGIGTSVTNASEQLASEITQKIKLDLSKCKFFEWYSEYGDTEVDEISYVWEEGKASNPQWKHIKKNPFK